MRFSGWFLALAMIAAPANAQEQQRVFLGLAGDGVRVSVYADGEGAPAPSINNRAWIMMNGLLQYPQPQPMGPSDERTYRSVSSFMEIRCGERQWRVQTAMYFASDDWSGGALAWTNVYSAWYDAATAPTSAGAMLVNYACKG